MKRKLTPRQAGVLFCSLVFVAAVGYAAYRRISAVAHQRAVRAAIAGYLASLRTQRDDLAASIEKYHAQFGFYPPNHSTNRERAALNPLYYELTGTQWMSNYQAFRLPNTKNLLKIDTARNTFQMTAFSNSLTGEIWPTNFLHDLRFISHEQDDVLLLASPQPEAIDDQVADDFNVTPWRYTADPAEHNSGRFDLWVEVDVLGQHFVIGNWPAVP